MLGQLTGVTTGPKQFCEIRMSKGLKKIGVLKRLNRWNASSGIKQSKLANARRFYIQTNKDLK